MIRTSKAQWNGSLKDGKGTVSLGSGAYDGQYSFSSRFESGTGTNPEELVAAAHAGCSRWRFRPASARPGSRRRELDGAKVNFEKVGDGFSITRIDLVTEGEVPGIDQATFIEYAEAAKEGLPDQQGPSAAVEITLSAKLVQA